MVCWYLIPGCLNSSFGTRLRTYLRQQRFQSRTPFPKSPEAENPLHGPGLITLQPVLLILLLSLSLLSGTSSSAVAQSSQFEVSEASILELQSAMTDGQITSLMLVNSYLERIAAYDQQGPQINAILHLNSQARAQARALDQERQLSGPRSLLHGIPVIIKDNYNTTDMPTTGASRALANFFPDRNATQVDRLLAAGAVILAKANLHEFAYGINTISSLGGQTLNPYDLERIPGGSSGGTAAAVAASFASFGMGSDTCGSIRIPAAFNNLIGLRPTKGLSSIYGMMPLSHTQDVSGPLARSAEDLAIVLDLLTAYDPRDDATQLLQQHPQLNFQSQLGTASFSGLRIGRLDTYYQSADKAVQELFDAALAEMVQMGAQVVDFTIPDMSVLIGRSGLIGHEFETDLNNYLQEFGSTEYRSLEAIVASGLHHEALHVLLSRSAAGEQDPVLYQAAMVARTDLTDAITEAMKTHQIDVIAYPPIGALPVRTGEVQPGNNCSLSGNSGLPALSLPTGFSADGLPVAVELLGPQLSDAWLLAIAYAYEQGSGLPAGSDTGSQGAPRHRRAPSSTPGLSPIGQTEPIPLLTSPIQTSPIQTSTTETETQ